MRGRIVPPVVLKTTMARGDSCWSSQTALSEISRISTIHHLSRSAKRRRLISVSIYFQELFRTKCDILVGWARCGCDSISVNGGLVSYPAAINEPLTNKTLSRVYSVLVRGYNSISCWILLSLPPVAFGENVLRTVQRSITYVRNVMYCWDLPSATLRLWCTRFLWAQANSGS